MEFGLGGVAGRASAGRGGRGGAGRRGRGRGVGGGNAGAGHGSAVCLDAFSTFNRNLNAMRFANNAQNAELTSTQMHALSLHNSFHPVEFADENKLAMCLDFNYKHDSAANFALARELVKFLIAAKDDLLLIKSILSNIKYRTLVYTAIYSYIPNWGTLYNTIAPCGRCFYSMFFSSLNILLHDACPTHAIDIRTGGHLAENEYCKMLAEFEKTPAFTQLQRNRDHSERYNGMKSLTIQQDINQFLTTISPLPGEYWGTSFMLDYLPIHPNQQVHFVEGDDDTPLYSKAFFLWNQDQRTQGTFKLSIFLSRQNEENLAERFVLCDFLSRMKDVEDERLETHSFAYGGSHYFNVSEVVNDTFLANYTNAALEQCAHHTQLYLKKFDSWGNFGIGGSFDQAAKELAIMALMFNTFTLVTPTNLASALVPIPM